jgi:hypothetical protein
MRWLPYPLERPLRGLRFRLSRRLPELKPAEVWPGIEAISVRLCPFAGTFRRLRRYDLIVLCAAVRMTEAATVFEFGTGDGLTTWHLAANACPGAHLWTLDLPPEYPARRGDTEAGLVIGEHFLGTAEGDRVEQVCCDSLTFNAEPYRGLIDFCFLNARHDFMHVCRDTASALAMVPPGGTIVWHAYSRWWPGVQKCLDRLARRLPLVSVAGTSLAVLRVPTDGPSVPFV